MGHFGCHRVRFLFCRGGPSAGNIPRDRRPSRLVRCGRPPNGLSDVWLSKRLPGGKPLSLAGGFICVNCCGAFGLLLASWGIVVGPRGRDKPRIGGLRFPRRLV